MADVDLDAIRERVKGPLHEALHALEPRIPNLDVGDCHCNLLAEVALDALMPMLAEAGLLLPAGGETREELSWSHRDGSDCATPDYCAPYTERVERRITEWPDGTELTTPWMPVDLAEDATEGATDVG
jgi:hypothetical protein